MSIFSAEFKQFVLFIKSCIFVFESVDMFLMFLYEDSLLVKLCCFNGDLSLFLIYLVLKQGLYGDGINSLGLKTL